MRFKADTGESNTGLFKEVKLNRDRPMGSASQDAKPDTRRGLILIPLAIRDLPGAVIRNLPATSAM
jgi:hypothetical protein